MRQLVIASLVVSSLAGAAPFDSSGIADWTTPPPPTAEPTFTPPVAKRMRLANGISVVVVENHGLPIVSMELVVPGAGSAYDPSGKPGVAAFTADMLDEGSAGMSAIQIAEQADRLGASITPSVSTDAAYVRVTALTATLDPTLELLTKVVTKPTASDADFARVAGDRATELELLRDRPSELAFDVLYAALYGGDTPYGHPRDGRRGSFSGITFADLHAFYASQWNPNLMTLAVAGDVDGAKLVAKLNAGLGAWRPPGAKPLRLASSPAMAAKRLQLVDRPKAQQSDVRIGVVAIDHKDKRYSAYEVLANALCGGFTSRLNQRLREQLGIIYHIYSVTDWRLQPGPFAIWTAIETPETAHGVAEALKIIADFATTEMSDAELDKAKQNLIRALPSPFGTNSGTVSTLGELALLGLPDNYYAHYAEGIRRVTAADVKAAAKEAMPAGKFVISIVGDMAKVKAGLDALDLGGAAMHDLYGDAIK